MEAQAYEVLQLLSSSTTVDSKLSHLTSLKSEIKQKHVPETAVSNCFEIARKAVQSPHSSLSNVGFSLLTNLLKRLSLQQQYHHIAAQGHNTYPVLLERLGDSKERIRNLASQGFTDFWTSLASDVRSDLEKTVLESGLTNKNARTKETSLAWLNRMAKDYGLLFRPYLSNMVACLEDADPGVRETAKSTIIDVVKGSDGTISARAVSDLKRQFQNHNVRKAMTTSILSQIEREQLSASMQSVDEYNPTDMPQSRPHTRVEGLRAVSNFSQNQSETTSGRTAPSHHVHSKSDTTKDAITISYPPKADPPRKDAVSTSFNEAETAPAPAATNEQVDPMYINSNRDLDDIYRIMEPHFEGKESEQNWLAREKDVNIMRRITKGNAPADYYTHYISGFKGLLDGVLRTANSLRTTLSTKGCTLIQEVVRRVQSGLDPMAENILQNMIRLSGGTKKISAQNANLTVDAIIGNVSYHSSILQHVWSACQDKNVQPRLYSSGWLSTMLNKHGRQMERGGGFEIVEKCIRKGLNDANPGVRESMRSTYWKFARVSPDKAENIMCSLDSKYRQLLEKHPSNPNVESAPIEAPAARPNFSKSTTAVPGRPSLKETIAAQKRARLAGKDLPPRPESAQSVLSESKAPSTTAQRPGLTASASARPLSSVSSISSSQTGSLSSAPMRPNRPLGVTRRPEIPRPATADPYSARRAAASGAQSKTSSPTQSPSSKPRSKTTTLPPSKDTSPLKPKLKKADSAVSTSVKAKPTPIEGFMTTNDLKVISTPGRKLESREQVDGPVAPSTPTAVLEDFTMVLPQAKTTLTATHTSPQKIQAAEQSVKMTPVQTNDPFHDPQLGSTMKEHMVADDHKTQTSTGVARSFNNHSPPGSAGFSNTGTLKVYEDPEEPEDIVAPSNTAAQKAVQQTPKPVKALEELPVNEPVAQPFRRLPPEERDLRSASAKREKVNENTHRKWDTVETSEKKRSISPRSKDLPQARVMLDKGTEKIRAGTLDVHGYRKLQGLIKHHDQIFIDEAKYDDLLLSLLDALERPNDDKRAALGRPVDIKTQILVTIRLMLAQNRQYFAAYHPRTMSSVLSARRYHDSSSHIVSGLEKTAEDIVSVCSPLDVMTAVLNLIETASRDEEGNRAIAMGLHVLTGLLHRVNEKNMTLEVDEEDRLGKLAYRCMREDQSDVRRAVIDYCSELKELLKPEERFWALSTGGVDDSKSLLSYYFEKNKRPQKRA